MDPDPRIILLEGPENLRKPAGSDAVIAAHKQFSLFQPKDPGTFLPDLPAPIKEFSNGGQQPIPLPGQLHPLGREEKKGEPQVPFKTVQHPSKT